jgi:hypothetical protein
VTPTQRYMQGEQRRRQAQQDAMIPLSPTELVTEAAERAKPPGKGGRFSGSQAFLDGLADKVRGNKFKLAGAGGLLAVLAGAAELADQGDPLSKNIAEALGLTGGNLAGGMAGAAAGTAMGGPVGGVIGGILGATGGGAAGKGAMTGLYNLVTGEDPDDRKLELLAKQRRLEMALENEALQGQIPLMAEIAKLKQADDFERLKMQAAVNRDYNFANTMNTAALNAQQNAQVQQALLTQALFS